MKSQTIKFLQSLLTDENKSSPANLKNLVGKRFGMLEVISRAGSDKNKRALWLCRCDCGNKKIVSTKLLSSGDTKSCGCFGYSSSVERLKSYRTKHNKYHTRLYTIWRGIKQRCYCPKNVRYDRYGARGICVCDEWKNDFASFYNWSIENGYTDEKLLNGKYKWTIERINNNGNYEPENCKWATIEEQSNNKCNNRFIEYNGEVKTVAQWARFFEMNPYIIYHRLFKGWDVQKALTTPKIIKGKSYETKSNAMVR